MKSCKLSKGALPFTTTAKGSTPNVAMWLKPVTASNKGFLLSAELTGIAPLLSKIV